MTVAVLSSLILGLVVGLPYYGLPFFYDYLEAAHGWPRQAILFGLPIGTLVTLIAGPLLVRRVPPRAGIVIGSLVCGAAVAGFGFTRGSLAAYFALWIAYMTAWTFAGPIMHQVLLTRVYPHKRGTALAIAFFGISAFGALSVNAAARPLTAAFGFETALAGLGLLVALAAPVAWFGLPSLAPEPAPAPHATHERLSRNRHFWLLIAGSTLSISGIGAVSQHLKLMIRDAIGPDQARVDAVFGLTLMIMLGAGALGRFTLAWAVDRFPKRHVITLAFVLMAGALPALFYLDSPRVPYFFGAFFGLGMSTDSLLVALLAADLFGPSRMGRALGVILPINNVGQTWFPSAVTLLWAATGGYTVPVWVTIACVLTGRVLLALLPADPPAAA